MDSLKNQRIAFTWILSSSNRLRMSCSRRSLVWYIVGFLSLFLDEFGWRVVDCSVGQYQWVFDWFVLVFGDGADEGGGGAPGWDDL